MKNNNHIIKIEDIENAPGKKLQYNFEDLIEDLELKQPLKAELELISLGEFIQITGHVQGTAILECDLCLEKFDYEIKFDIDELFAKNSLIEEYAEETEIKEGQFVTDLAGATEIDISELLYQSVILDFPNKKVCGINCKGGDIFIRDENPPENETDPRMAVFKDIKLDGNK